jgi:hypothetical protein
MNDTVYRRSLLAVAFAAIALVLAAIFLPDASFASLFEENGPIEWLSVAGWLVVSLVFVRAALQGAGPVAWLGAVLTLAAALREADLHKVLTGYSVLKVSFYTGAGFAIWQKLLAAFVVIPAAVAMVALSWMLLRRLLGGGLRHWSVRLVLVAIGLLVFSKLLDRTPAVMFEWFGVQFSPLMLRLMLAFEEGIETLLPFAFLLPFLVARREASRHVPRAGALHVSTAAPR